MDNLNPLTTIRRRTHPFLILYLDTRHSTSISITSLASEGHVKSTRGAVPTRQIRLATTRRRAVLVALLAALRQSVKVAPLEAREGVLPLTTPTLNPTILVSVPPHHLHKAAVVMMTATLVTIRTTRSKMQTTCH
jgi:hypothetical protein